MQAYNALLKKPSVCLLASTLLLTKPVFAELAYVDLTLEQLLFVSVHSASKKSERVADAPAAIYAITSADIERLGVTTIPDALRLVPGVEVARADSNSWAISIRGFNSTLANKLLVLVDGRTIYNPVFGGVLWEANDLLLEDIERIEVIRGPGGALWGANAVNGVINIVTKHTRDTQGTLVTALAGNEEQGTLSIRNGGEFTDGSYRLYAKGFKRDESLRPRADGSPEEDTYDEWDGFRTGFRVDFDNQFTVQGDAYRTDAQQLRPQLSLIAPYAAIREQNIIYEGANILGRWTDEKEDGSRLNIQTYVDWTKRDEPFNFIDERTTFDLEAQYDFAPSTRQEIIAGAAFRLLSDDKQGDNNVSFSSQKNNRNIYSLFAQDKITVVPESWFLILGAKVEHNEISGEEWQPNIRLQWQVNQYQNFWASVSRAVRTPTPVETELTSTLATAENIRIAFVPNEDYQSEELIAYELGYRNQLTANLSVDIASFHNEYEKLSTTAVGEPVLVINTIDAPHILVPVQFTNDMTGTSSGIEMVLDWKVNDQLQITADYSYLDLSLDAIDPTHEGAEHLSAAHQVGTKIYWDFAEDWTLGTAITYVDELPLVDVDSYVRLDVNFGVIITPALKFNLVGQNLLENSHREFGSVADLNVGEIERSIFGKLTWQF